VSYSPVLKWFLILALPLTLGSKLIVRPDRSAPSETDVLQTVAKFLVRQHFAVTLSDPPPGEGQPMIRATAGACRVLVANSNPIAWDRDVIRRNATVADRVFVVFRGRTYEEQPTWLTVPYFLWSRLQRELGLGSQAAPLLAVIAAAGCNADRLPWSEIGPTSERAYNVPGPIAGAGLPG
jgi:hypothetical protein